MIDEVDCSLMLNINVLINIIFFFFYIVDDFEMNFVKRKKFELSIKNTAKTKVDLSFTTYVVFCKIRVLFNFFHLYFLREHISLVV